jgi:hypothetical protein
MELNMVDFTSSNLQAANEKYNNIVSKLNDVKNDALANLQTEASSATAALSSQLSNVTTELRSLIPEPTSIPNINLQAQLQSLSGLTDLTQSANLLTSINTNFSTALTSSGFNLDTLVSSASAAVAAGTSLSGTIPNFELPASGIGDAIQKASNVKIPSIDPVVEEVSTFIENASMTSAKSAAASAVISTSKTLPTADAGVLRVSEKYKKVTQTQNGVAITKEVTTASQAVETKVTGGGETVVTRKNISSKGFSHQTQPIVEKFTYDALTSTANGITVLLSKEPVKIKRVKGYTQEREQVGVFANGKPRTRNQFMIVAEGGDDPYKRSYTSDTWSLGEKTSAGTELNIAEKFREYDRETRKNSKTGETVNTYVIYVSYTYHKTYDPIYAKLEEA